MKNSNISTKNVVTEVNNISSCRYKFALSRYNLYLKNKGEKCVFLLKNCNFIFCFLNDFFSTDFVLKIIPLNPQSKSLHKTLILQIMVIMPFVAQFSKISFLGFFLRFFVALVFQLRVIIFCFDCKNGCFVNCIQDGTKSRYSPKKKYIIIPKMLKKIFV